MLSKIFKKVFGSRNERLVKRMSRVVDQITALEPYAQAADFLVGLADELAGMGIRLDGGTAYSGAVITRYYDSLLEKVTAWAPTPAAPMVWAKVLRIWMLEMDSSRFSLTSCRALARRGWRVSSLATKPGMTDNRTASRTEQRKDTPIAMIR